MFDLNSSILRLIGADIGAGGAEFATRAPALMNMPEGQRVQLPDGSYVSPADLGFTPQDMLGGAGIGTPVQGYDPSGDQAYLALPSQADLNRRAADSQTPFVPPMQPPRPGAAPITPGLDPGVQVPFTSRLEPPQGSPRAAIDEMMEGRAGVDTSTPNPGGPGANMSVWDRIMGRDAEYLPRTPTGDGPFPGFPPLQMEGEGAPLRMPGGAANASPAGLPPPASGGPASAGLPGTGPAIGGANGGSGPAAGGAGTISGIPQAALAGPEAYDPETGTRDPETRALSIFERIFGEADTDERRASGRAIMMAGAQIMKSTGSPGQAIGAGIEAGLLTYDEVMQAMREEARTARALEREEEAHAIEMEMKRLALQRARSAGAGGPGSGGSRGNPRRSAAAGLAEDAAAMMLEYEQYRAALGPAGADLPPLDPSVAWDSMAADRGQYRRSAQMPESDLPF